MINPAIVGPAAGMVVGGVCYVACVLRVLRGTAAKDIEAFIVGLAVAAFVGGFLGYKSVVWLGLLAT
jgi:hypothetical protein